MSQFILTAIQSRILLALLFGGPQGSSGILDAVGISSSSWAKERKLLMNSGLLSWKSVKEMGEKGVVKSILFSLTDRGRIVSQNLLAISTLLGQTIQKEISLENLILTQASIN